MTIKEAKIKQNELAEKIDELRVYLARGSKYIDLKESVSKNVKRLYDGWEKFVNGFKNGILPPSKKIDVKTNIGDQQQDILDTPEQKKINDFLSQIKEKQKSIDMNLFKEVFGFDGFDFTQFKKSW